MSLLRDLKLVISITSGRSRYLSTSPANVPGIATTSAVTSLRSNSSSCHAMMTLARVASGNSLDHRLPLALTYANNARGTPLRVFLRTGFGKSRKEAVFAIEHHPRRSFVWAFSSRPSLLPLPRLKAWWVVGVSVGSLPRHFDDTAMAVGLLDTGLVYPQPSSTSFSPSNSFRQRLKLLSDTGLPSVVFTASRHSLN